jgi:hypothetical protein
MDDTKNPSPADSGDGRSAELAELERMLNEGIDDLDAGRTVSREESRREIEKLFSIYEKKSRPTS